MKHEILPYNPGDLPSRPAPIPGEAIEVEVEGWPPWKDTHFSIRNSRHRIHTRFLALRTAATKAMKGRAWYHGPVELDLEMYAPHFEPRRALLDYMSGNMDTLDGSHGLSFTYLPIVYEDDCQVVDGSAKLITTPIPHYRLRVKFLPYDVMDG